MSLTSLIAAAVIAVAALLAVLEGGLHVAVPAGLLVLSRWAAVAALVAVAIRRRSLTTWILVAMVAGAEFGHDAPAIAIEFRIFSLIFLRLIKTIIAPLIFGTLVVGIAGHSNLRQVGRMGVKALIYFEVVTTLALFIGVVLFPVALMARVPLRRFAKAVAEPVSIAFATTSSEAALPSAMEAMERLGVPRQIVAFVMPTGYSFNLDGTTLYLSLAAIFVAQAANVEMSMGQQFTMLVTLMLTSKGVAGVPRASLIILLGTLASFNLPSAPVLIILGIDELMDMARTATNVLGNCLATVVIARWEGEFNDRPEPAIEAL
jgi:Na+/H+-dicarboxylate symporter